MAKSALDPLRAKADRAFGSARDAARHTRATVEEGRRAFPQLAQEAQRAFADGVDQIRNQAGDAADSASEQLDSARLYLVERVQEHPLTVTVAALAAGFVLGLLFVGGRR